MPNPQCFPTVGPLNIAENSALDPDLAHLIAIWDELPERIRTMIRSLIHAAAPPK